MTRTPFSTARGLSLVELLVSLALAAMMLAPLATLVRNMGTASALASDREALVREADYALERIATAVRTTPATILNPHGDNGDSGDWLNTHFKFEHDQLMQKGPDGVLADNVTDFSITAPTVNDTAQQLVQVSLTLTRGDSSVTATMTQRLGGPR